MNVDEPAFCEEVRHAPEPEEAFLRLADLPWVLFLDSARSDAHLGRYSYLCASPVEVVLARSRGPTPRTRKLRARSGSIEAPGYETVETSTDPFVAVRTLLGATTSKLPAELPPFLGGVAGLFGYGLLRSIERIPENRFDEFTVPDLAVGLYDWVLAYDHLRGTCHLVANDLPLDSRATRGSRARERADQVLARVRGEPRTLTSHVVNELPALPVESLAPQFPVERVPGLTSDFSRAAYLRAVERTIEYIRAGDAFQVNLSQRLLAPLADSPVEFYRRLRRSNPGSFAAYMDLGDHVVASSSPEQFLALSSEGEVYTRPIKGTRSRGYSAEEDVYRSVDLRESEKDRAENVMIVDLLRNDLSRVCEPGSVVVPRLFELERHPTVHHLVSEVRGRLRGGCDAVELLRASFPGGSITGAPKVRAMEIISELEPTERGPYCGSLVWIGLDGAMGSNILIRTVTASRGWIQLPAGGGIVADSSPVAEYQETLDKAAGIVRAI